jgi:hypothetical protein
VTVTHVDTSDAERRALKISLRLDSIADNFEAVMPMIREALELGDHLALGYRSPGEYLSTRFGNALERLPLVMRREAVRELTAAGLSTRAIAPVVGVSNFTVHADQAAVRDLTPEIEPDYVTDEADLIVNHETGEILDAPEPRPITGIDGKTYTSRREPVTSPPRRRAITDQFFDAAYDMGKAIEKVARLTEDDRFPQNAEKVAAKHRSDLLRARDLLEQVINRLA